MFKDEYQAVFSQVTASRETHRRILAMTRKTKKRRSPGGWTSKILLAAVLVSLLAVTASAVAQNWFVTYFSREGEKPLSQGQVEFIEENTQDIQQSQTCNGWTITLRTAISDGVKGYVQLSVTAPADVDLSQIPQSSDYFGSRNDFLPKSEDTALTCDAYPEVGVLAMIGSRWQEDGDGLKNTVNYTLDISPDMEWAECDPFAPDTKWHLHWVDFVKGFPEQETVAEGTWDFDFTFRSSKEEIALLDSPIQTEALVLHGSGEHTMENVTLVSATLRPFGLTVYYGDERDSADYSRDNVSFGEGEEGETPWYAVMKDGQKIALHYHGGNPVERYSYMEAETPLVLTEVDHILLSDGTILSMPASE